MEYKSYNKGELSLGFNKTSIGTTPQDEKNIQLDALDGDSSYIPRADTYASATLAGSLRMRKDQKERSSWQQLLFLINQLQRSIETDFLEISEVINELKEECKNTLQIINNLNSQIDDIQHDHHLISQTLRNSEDIDRKQANIDVLMHRYRERTGKDIINYNDLSLILLSQIEFERSNLLPELQSQLQSASQIYDNGINVVNNLSIQLEEQRIVFDQINSQSNSEEQLLELEELSQQMNYMKITSQDALNTMNEELESLNKEKVSGIEIKHSTQDQNSSRSKSIDLQSFGIKVSTPTTIVK